MISYISRLASSLLRVGDVGESTHTVFPTLVFPGEKMSLNSNNHSEISKFDALLPRDMARKVESVGIQKAEADTISTLVLAILAGAFISLGAVFATTVTTGAGELPYGLVKLLGGISFCLGLILVIVAGAELFTGNNLIVMAWASKRVRTKAMLRNWILVYFGNFIGAVGTALLMFFSGQYRFGSSSVGLTAIKIALTKCQLEWDEALILGVMCNALVCLAVWLCFSARTTTDRILAIIFPISAFVASGFEHCVANMYFVPFGLLIKNMADTDFWIQAGTSPEAFQSLNLIQFLMGNLLPVTLGNIFGGAGMVGLIYWFIYIRAGQKTKEEG